MSGHADLNAAAAADPPAASAGTAADPPIADAPGPRALDLRGIPCPLNWVRTRLALEVMPRGAVLVVRLDAGEPRESVPRSAREDGHVVELDGDLVRIVRR